MSKRIQVSYPYQKVKGKMRELDYTLQTLAKELNITLQSLSNKLNGFSEFKMSEIVMLCETLSIKEEDLQDYFFEPVLRFLNKTN